MDTINLSEKTAIIERVPLIQPESSLQPAPLRNGSIIGFEIYSHSGEFAPSALVHLKTLLSVSKIHFGMHTVMIMLAIYITLLSIVLKILNYNRQDD